MNIVNTITSIKKFITRFCYILGCLFALKYGGNFGFYLYESGYLNKIIPTLQEKIITKIVEVPEQQSLSRDELLNEFEKAGCPRIVGETLLENEDAGKYRSNAKRCEWESKDWLKIASRYEPNDKEQRDALRCSYGPFQVAGWWARKYNKDWNDLLYARVNATLACEIFKANFSDAQNSKGLEAQYWTAFRMYNGSGEKAEAYADKSINFIKHRATEQLLASQGFAIQSAKAKESKTYAMGENEKNYAEKIMKGLPITKQEERQMLAELEAKYN